MPFRFLPVLLLVAGCAATSVPWVHHELPKDQWGRDWSACRRWADTQVGYVDNDSSVFRDYDRSRAKKQVDGYAAMCMTERGYVPAAKKK